MSKNIKTTNLFIEAL